MKNPAASDTIPASAPLPEAAGVPHSPLGGTPAAGAGVGAATGAATGAVLGAFAGPPGMIAGAIIGAVAGAATGVALVEDHDQEELDGALDAEIGVSGGDMGAAKPGAIKAKRGVYSAASAGAGAGGALSDDAPDAGPMPKAD